MSWLPAAVQLSPFLASHTSGVCFSLSMQSPAEFIDDGFIEK